MSWSSGSTKLWNAAPASAAWATSSRLAAVLARGRARE